MKITFNTTNFGEHSEPYRYIYKNSKIDVYFDAGGYLMQTCENDMSGKFYEVINFDAQNKIIGYHRCDYANSDKSEYVEYFKNKYQEYTRKAYQEQRGEFSHKIEEFICKTNPLRNYKMETVRDASGKIIKSIMNGKILFDKLAKKI